MRNHNNTTVEKKQGVYYNTEFGRWEYYGTNSVIRACEQQPSYVSTDYDECEAYKMAMEGVK